MKKFLMLLSLILCLCVYATAGAQVRGGRAVLTIEGGSTPSIMIHVREKFSDNEDIYLEGAQVMLVMNKDTVRIKTDKNGRAPYDGRLLTNVNVLEITVSCPGYVTQSGTRPVLRGKSVGAFYLKKEIKPEPKPKPASKPDAPVKKDDETPISR